MRLWRVLKAKYAPTGAAAFAGTGGLYAHGRWHSRGRPICYSASSEALAKLEALVHLPPPGEPSLPSIRWALVEAVISDRLVESLPASRLPRGWDEVPDAGSGRRVGDAWLTSGRSVALAVPSIHSRSEKNVLINPAHAAFARVKIHPPVEFSFDGRLLDSSTR